jgi:hypothetical protein
MKVGIYGDPQLYEAMYPMAGKRIEGEKNGCFLLKNPEAADDSFQVLFVGGEDLQAVKNFSKSQR